MNSKVRGNPTKKVLKNVYKSNCATIRMGALEAIISLWNRDNKITPTDVIKLPFDEHWVLEPDDDKIAITVEEETKHDNQNLKRAKDD